MMDQELEVILDRCIDRINKGETLDQCLADYPAYAIQLEPLLRSLTQTQKVFAFTPSPDAVRKGRLQLYAAMEKRRKTSFWKTIFSGKTAWVTAACTIVLVLAVYAGLRYTVFNGNNGDNYVVEPSPSSFTPEPTGGMTGTPSIMASPNGTMTPGATASPNATETPAASITPDVSVTPEATATPDATGTPESEPVYYAQSAVGGNFIFLVSDEVNYVADFESIDVTIEKVNLFKTGDEEGWIEFEPSIQTFDLTLLPGDVTQELWEGDVPVGEYSKVVIYVSSVSGVLNSDGSTIDIKLPSDKLHVDSDFEVSEDSVTSFIFDLTVGKTGNGKYIVKPQAGESGASQSSTKDNITSDDTAAEVTTETSTDVNTSSSTDESEKNSGKKKVTTNDSSTSTDESDTNSSKKKSSDTSSSSGKSDKSTGKS